MASSSRRPSANPQRSQRDRFAAPAPTTRLTHRQEQILEWIRSFIDSRGMPPTRAEIASALGFSTPSSAEDHLQALAKKGVLDIVPGAARGIRLRDRPGVPLQATLPLIGRVAAGNPILAAQHVEAHYRVDPALFAPRADYLLRVRGDSMKDAGMLDGDLLAVHRTGEARTGQIVVARLDEDVTVKRFRRRGRDIVLVPENRDYAPIVVDPSNASFAIEGLAVGLLRNGSHW
jgi:repressor LexA